MTGGKILAPVEARKGSPLASAQLLEHLQVLRDVLGDPGVAAAPVRRRLRRGRAATAPPWPWVRRHSGLHRPSSLPEQT